MSRMWISILILLAIFKGSDQANFDVHISVIHPGKSTDASCGSSSTPCLDVLSAASSTIVNTAQNGDSITFLVDQGVNNFCTVNFEALVSKFIFESQDPNSVASFECNQDSFGMSFESESIDLTFTRVQFSDYTSQLIVNNFQQASTSIKFIDSRIERISIVLDGFISIASDVVHFEMIRSSVSNVDCTLCSGGFFAVTNEKANVNIQLLDSSFSDIEAYSGGVFWVYGQPLSFSMQGCTVRRAVATGDNGGFATLWTITTSTIQVTNCDIQECSASIGGVFYVLNRANVELTSSVFKFNLARSSHGGVMILRQYCSLTISDLTLYQNRAPSQHGGNFRMWRDSRFIANRVTLFGTNDGSNRDSVYGTLLSSDMLLEFNLNNSILEHTYQGHGGIIAAWTSPGAVSPTYVVSNCTFRRNRVWSIGGSIFFQNNDRKASLVILNSNFESSWAGRGGFFDIINFGSIFISGCTFREANAWHHGGAISLANVIEAKILDCEFIRGRTYTHSGGFIVARHWWYNWHPYIEIVNTVFKEMTIIHLNLEKYGSVLETNMNFLIKDCDMSSGLSGALFLNRYGGQPDTQNGEIVNTTISNIDGAGGLLRSDHYTKIVLRGVKGSRFINKRTNFNSMKNAAAVHAYGTSNITFIDCDLSIFEATQNRGVGAALFFNQSSAYFSHTSITASTFKGEENTGGILFAELSAIFITDSSFSSGKSSAAGGAIHIRGSTLNILNSSFNDNISGYGAAILAEASPYPWSIGTESSVVIIQSEFSNNFAEFGKSKGGSLSLLSKTESRISGSKFYHSQAAQGGAIYSTTFPREVTDSIFLYNAAKSFGVQFCLNGFGSGAAIYIQNSECETNNFLISGNEFIGNEAMVSGSGVYVELCSTFDTMSEIYNSNTWNISKLQLNESNHHHWLQSKISNFNTSIIMNQAVYGPEVSSLCTRIAMANEQTHFEFFFEVGLMLRFRMVDSFNQSCFSLQCSLFIFNLDSTSPGLLRLRNSRPAKVEIAESMFFDARFVYNLVDFFPPVISGINLTMKLEVWESDENPLRTNQLISMDITLCEPGFRLAFDQIYGYKCSKCIRGTRLVNTLNSSECEPCPPGYESPERSYVCNICPEGSNAPSPGTMYCQECTPGRYSPSNGSDACFTCPANTYQPLSWATSCIDCPISSITLENGSQVLESCVCPSGKWGRPWLDELCITSPRHQGTYMQENSSVPVVEKGFWRNPIDPSNIYRCFPSEACPMSSFQGSVCEFGYTNILCGECIPGEFYRYDGACKECATNGGVTIILLLGVLILLCLYAYRVLRVLGNFPQDIRVMVVWLQMISLFMKIGCNWPTEIQQLFEIFSFLNFNMKFFSPSCAAPMSFWSVYYIQMSFPLIVILLVFIITFLFTKYQDMKKRKLYGDDHEDEINMDGVEKNENDFEEKKVEPDALSKLIFLTCLIMSSMFVFLATTVFQPFQCNMQPDGSFSMVQIASVFCYRKEWWSNMPIFSFFCFTYIFLIPFLVFLAFIHYRKFADSIIFQWRFGALTLPYRREYYWWEGVVTVKKLSYVMLIDVVSSLTYYHRVFLIICFLMFFTGIELFLRPFANTRLNAVNAVWSFSTIILLLADALIFCPQSIGFVGQRITAFTLIFLVACVFLVSISKTMWDRVVGFIFPTKAYIEPEINWTTREDLGLRGLIAFMTSADMKVSVNPIHDSTTSLKVKDLDGVHFGAVETAEDALRNQMVSLNNPNALSSSDIHADKNSMHLVTNPLFNRSSGQTSNGQSSENGISQITESNSQILDPTSSDLSYRVQFAFRKPRKRETEDDE